MRADVASYGLCKILFYIGLLLTLRDFTAYKVNDLSSESL